MEVLLRKFEEKDIPKLISWIPSKDFLIQFAGQAYQFSLIKQQLKKDIEEMEMKNNNLMYKVIEKETKNVIGHIQLIRINTIDKTGAIGRLLIGDKSTRGKGIGVKIVNQLLDIAFFEIGLKTIRLNVYDFNIGAISCYKKVGFTIVNRIENKVEIDGEWRDCLVMEITLDKFLKLRQKDTFTS
ncbi:GNAT family N-acetyltransferase [Maledivibacter halophilus]|uniref:Protein N-acetyltransferase, RimJ/RimL family n=1 Tax=Maledivibacter halophilus TaxID=36842 RepID=A0A1T5KRK2_9FIRM|nr:GNAT family protein [Maledivibacter halophilus]SKC66049.1 Protein N-acetyltransferase, RimJ/RimL family [Maledivibacter halophilus]